MGSDFEQSKNAAPAMMAVAPGSIERTVDTSDMLASIGYEAADPSLFSPQWREAMLGQPNRRDLR
jgi:hypothetical protein